MSFQLLAVSLAGGESSEAPRTSNAAGFHVLNELVVLTFGYFDPLKIKSPAAEGQPATAEARPFTQIAMPRSAFASLLKAIVGSVKGLPERDTFGWRDLVDICSDKASEGEPK